MSTMKKIAETVRDNAVSFGIAAVPAFLGTAFMATCYSLAFGVASAIGLPTGLAVAAGIVGTVVSGGLSIGVGMLAGAGGLLGAASLAERIPGLRGAKVATPGLVAGIAAGLGASVMLAFNLTAAEPEADTSLIDQGPQVAVMEIEEGGSLLGEAFATADAVVVPAAEQETVWQADMANDPGLPRLAA